MGFGGLFGDGGVGKMQNALTDFSNQTAIQGGRMQQEAANMEAGAERDQADVAWKQGLQEAELTKREIAITAGNQQEQYLSSGVTMQGSPLLVVNETRKLGQIKVDSIMEQTQLMTDLLRTKADITERGGLSALLQAEGGAAVNSAQNKINQQMQKNARMQGILGGAIKGGFSMLGSLF
jgi:hypothetical protein